MADKTCPTCAKGWADSFRFCPEDGTQLVVVEAVTPAAFDERASNAPTVLQMQAFVPPERTETRVETKAQPAKARSNAKPEPVAKAEPAPKAPEARASKPKKNFSETAWFMQKIDPSMIDPATGRVIAETAKPPAEGLDAETRKRYSLRTDEDEE